MKRKMRGMLLLLVMALLFGSFSQTGYAKETKKTNKKTEKKTEKKVQTLEKVQLTKKCSYGYAQVTLKWEKVKKATGYEIYRRTGQEGKFELVATIKKNTRLSWSESKLENHRNYYYKIRAYKTTKKETIYGAFSKVYRKYSAKYAIMPVRQYTYVPYRGGGYSPSGWDCSGFTKWALKTFYGVDIPKGAASQGMNGKKINKNNRSKWKPGDILAYSNGSRISHVALYLGNGKLMHALSTKYGTIIQDVSYYERWDSGTFLVGVRRYTKG